VSTSKRFARKSGEGPLPYCNIVAISEGYNRPGPPVSYSGLCEDENFLGCSARSLVKVDQRSEVRDHSSL
jgi:hypothetical protein